MKKLIFIFMSFLCATPIYSMNIFQAIDIGDAARVRELIAQFPWIINSTNIGFNTPLHEAAYQGKLEIVKILIAANANVNATSGCSKKTPLHCAAYTDNTSVIQILLDSGAKIDAQDHSFDLYSGGQTALHIAAAMGNKNTLQALLANHANVNIQDDRGFTPLHAAAYGKKEYGQKPDIEVVQILLNNHARTDLKTNNNSQSGEATPWQLANKCGNDEIAQLIQDYLARQEMRILLQARQSRLGSGIVPAMKELPIWIYQDIFNLLRTANR